MIAIYDWNRFSSAFIVYVQWISIFECYMPSLSFIRLIKNILQDTSKCEPVVLMFTQYKISFSLSLLYFYYFSINYFHDMVNNTDQDEDLPEGNLYSCLITMLYRYLSEPSVLYYYCCWNFWLQNVEYKRVPLVFWFRTVCSSFSCFNVKKNHARMMFYMPPF